VELEVSETEDVAILSTQEQPLPLGVPFDTEGWKNLQFDVLGVIAPEVNAAIGVSEDDQQLVHVAFKVKGESRSEKRTNLYETLQACVPSVSLGSSGIAREVNRVPSIKSIGSLRAAENGNDKVSIGVTDEKFVIYRFEPSESDLRINSQTTVCGEMDVWIDVGSLAELPILGLNGVQIP